jgi:hypothetical protein
MLVIVTPGSMGMDVGWMPTWTFRGAPTWAVATGVPDRVESETFSFIQKSV